MKLKKNPELEKYLKYLLVDDYERFITAGPEPTAIRLNELKTSNQILEDFLDRIGVNYTQIQFNKYGYLIESENIQISHTLKYFCGNIYYQGVSSQLPVILLDVNPGDKVLDVAASPGSKSCQILSELKGKGELIVNDPSVKRMQPLNVNMQRSGATNFYILNMWGERLGQLYPEYFDKVLLDAPCTALGTLPSLPEVEEWWEPDKLIKLKKTQYSLLISAIKSAKVGGEIVYSTCSIAPEENEFVVNEILKKYPVEIVSPPELLKEQFESGHTKFNSEMLNEGLVNGVRVFPHIHGYEGFFAIKLRKYESTVNVARLKKQNKRPLLSFNDSKIEPVLENLTETWGIEESFWKDFQYNLTKNKVWMISNIEQIPANHFVCAGILLAEKRLFGWKLLNNSANILGERVTKRKIQLNDDDLKILFKEGHLTDTEFENGYFVLTRRKESIASVYVENKRMQIRLSHSFNLILD